MDSNTQRLVMGAAGSASAPSLYVEDVFSTWLYTGNSSTQTITNGIDLAGKGGLVWIKQRSLGNSHRLFDTLRGALNNISTNLTDASGSTANSLTAFNANGFNLGSNAGINAAPETHVSWTFRKAAKFFDVVTYTGNGAGTQLINHSLGSVPRFIIIKRTNSTGDWYVSARIDNAAQQELLLNSLSGSYTGNVAIGSYATSTQLKVGDSQWLAPANAVNISGATYVAYLFAHDAGGFGATENESIVKCGSFSHTFNTATTVELGWEPQWLLVKNTSVDGDWSVYDNMRGIPRTTGSTAARLYADLDFAEGLGPGPRPTSTGFVLDGNAENTGTIIYIAIRRGPMKTPTDATKVFSISQAVGTPRYQAAFPPDLIIQTSKSYAFNQPFSRITGTRYMTTTATTSEASFTGWTWDYMNGTGNSFTDSNYLAWMFRRAPGFFDVVAYTGTGSARTVAHNLGVVPEIIIVKGRGPTALDWTFWHKDVFNTNLILNSNSEWVNGGPSAAYGGTGVGTGIGSAFLNNSTASVFGLSSTFTVNGNTETFISYLFASCPGVSKVGKYIGTGTTLNVDCGFTAGARFVLIKRTDSTGDWYVWDTARGIIAANDPYLLLNSTAAEVTNTDYIDPLAAGFQISSTAPAAINANGGTYIYLAIA